MTIEEAKKTIKDAQIKALRVVGSYYKGEVEPFIPTSRGSSVGLRSTLRVDDDGETVFLITGDSSTPYARRQYFEKLGHLKRGGVLVAMNTIRPPGSERQKPGAGQKTLYQRAYRHAVKNNLLTKFKARWYDQVLRDKQIQKRAAQIFANSFK